MNDIFKRITLLGKIVAVVFLMNFIIELVKIDNSSAIVGWAMATIYVCMFNIENARYQILSGQSNDS